MVAKAIEVSIRSAVLLDGCPVAVGTRYARSTMTDSSNKETVEDIVRIKRESGKIQVLLMKEKKKKKNKNKKK